MTADSSLTGARVTPVAFSTFSVADPHGTCGAHTTTWVPGLARSANVAMPLGFPGGVTMVSVLVAKFTGIAGDDSGVDGLGHVLGVGGGEARRPARPG